MSDAFSHAFEIVVGLEGGYVNDPDDPGGETKYGIAKRYHPNVDIKSLTLDQAKQIYYDEYWKPCNCPNVAWPFSLYIFDCAVNQGVSRAKQLLDLAHGDVIEFMARRFMRYAEDDQYSKYGHGWFRRLVKIMLDSM